MPSVTSRPSGNPTTSDIFALEDERAASRVLLSPTRGALVTSFRVAERELLYLDEATLFDASKSVRGGIPVLFPSPGKLENDTFLHDGRTFTMKQHGFGRRLPWTVESTGTDGAASIVLGLASSAATLAQYPWAFRATIAFTLSHATLRITFRVVNESASEMPYGIGYHPYFAVLDKARASIDTRATKAFDNVTKQVVPFEGFDLTQSEVDMHLVDHGSTESALHVTGGPAIRVSGSPEFTGWVVWTLAGKPFVCLEPWSCAGNALNTGERLIRVPPGGSHESWVEIAARA